jgi:Tol biopolymer transport system component
VKLAGIVAALMLFAIVPAADATTPGQNAKLAFIRMAPDPGSGGRTVDIYTVDPDGMNPTNVTNTPGIPEGDPAWSPEGQRIAFTSFQNGADGEELYSITADGSNLARLTYYPGNFPCVDDPAWSPDGQKIAFTDLCSTVDGHSEIYVINMDGSGAMNLSNTPGVSDAYPTWAPDGQTLAFASADTPTPVIFTVSPNGTGRAPLMTGPLNTRVSGLDWSPNGASLAVSGTFDDPGSTADDIYTIGRDGTGLTRLTSTATFDAEPSWSPDGSTIAFESCDDETSCGDNFSCLDTFPCDGNLLGVDPTGSNVTTITSGSSDTDPNWQTIAINGYARPKGARAVRVPLVPAYTGCSEPNNQHGEALAFGSCSPPQLASEQLTVGTADSNLKPASMLATAKLDPITGDPATPEDEADLALKVIVNDVFSKDLSDYIGELRPTVVVRITDKDNTPNPGGPGAATTVDFPFGFDVPCIATDSTSVGSLCELGTSAEAIVPNTIKEGRRSIWEVGAITVYDGGPDGDGATTSDNTLFATQGLFVP